MNLYVGNPDSDNGCVAAELERRYRMFLAQGFTPAEAAQEAKEIMKFEWLVDQGRNQDQASQLVRIPLRSMMMTTFSQKPADLGYPARIQWLLDRGLYGYEEATVLAFHSFDVLVVMHDEVEQAAGRQHRIQDYFTCNRNKRIRPSTSKVVAVKPSMREKMIASTGRAPQSNLDRLLTAPRPKHEEEMVAQPPVRTEPTPITTKKVSEPVVTKKPSFKWTWTSSRANLPSVATVATQIVQYEEDKTSATSTKDVSSEPSLGNAPPPKILLPVDSQALDTTLQMQRSQAREPVPEPEEPPRPIPSLAAIPDVQLASSSSSNLKWSSSIPTITTRGNNIVLTPEWEPSAPSRPVTFREPESRIGNNEFSLNWEKAWGDADAAGQHDRWANFNPAQDVEEDPNDPYGVQLLNRPNTVGVRSSSPVNQVNDLYTMLNRFQ